MYKINANNTGIGGSEKAPIILALRDNTDLVYVFPDIFLCSHQHVNVTIIRSYYNVCDLLFHMAYLL